MNSFSFTCSQCHKRVTVPVQAAGMQIRCPACKSGLTVPTAPTAPKGPAATPTRPRAAKRVPPVSPVHALYGVIGVQVLVVFGLLIVSATRTPSVQQGGVTAAPRREASPAQLSATRKGARGQLTTEEVFALCSPAAITVVAEKASGSTQGSGFFVREDGILLTNHHVIDGADALYVQTAKDQLLKATILGFRSEIDVAVLQVRGKAFPIIQLGDSDSVAIGSSAVAIGTPEDMGLAQSITQGIISGRRLFCTIPCFQTSVLINHGNSGGPLLDLSGRAIGITTAGLGTALITAQGNIGSDIQGINFAVEINEAKKLLRDLSVRLTR